MNQLIKCQAYIRRYLTNKRSLFNIVATQNVAQGFHREVLGYHIINEEPIKEARWEEINRNFMSRYCRTNWGAFGSHRSGVDNIFQGHSVSNKTAKMTGNKIQVSSYRLTSKCSKASPGNIDDIVDEIERRDESFQYYSLLVRDEYMNQIHYMWYLIPRDYYIFNTRNHTWCPTIGRDKTQTGWMSNHAKIVFSMSSQLWFSFDAQEIDPFLVSSVDVDLTLPRISYGDLYRMFDD